MKRQKYNYICPVCCTTYLTKFKYCTSCLEEIDEKHELVHIDTYNYLKELKKK